jgi:hypothetical protein
MMAIFSEFIEEIIEVFMDDFSVYGKTLVDCLANLDKVLTRCAEVDLVLNWKKCHFFVKQGIVLVHVISERGIEVDTSKVETVEQLPPPTDVKSLMSFLGHARFYRRFIKDFSKITKPLTQLLQKDVSFQFDEKCLAAFRALKGALVSAPIIQHPDWSQPFEIMCDASDYAVGAVLGQRKEGRVHVVYYFSKTLSEAQLNYVKKRKMGFLEYSFPDYLNWPKWELWNPSQFTFFCTQAAAMTSPKSIEMKLGAKEALAEEAK